MIKFRLDGVKKIVKNDFSSSFSRLKRQDLIYWRLVSITVFDAFSPQDSVEKQTLLNSELNPLKSHF